MVLHRPFSSALTAFRNMVFNDEMSTDAHKDWDLVLKLGGPTKTAAALGWTAPGSSQRVSNWKRRGVPSEVKLERPDLFQPNVRVLTASVDPHEEELAAGGA